MSSDSSSGRSGIESFNATYAALCTRAMQDVEFRARAIADPAAAWREVGGSEMPAGLAIAFVEPHQGAHFVLPMPACDDGELSDASLAAVAGGKGGGTHSGTHVPSCSGTPTCKTTSGSTHGGTAHASHVHVHL